MAAGDLRLVECVSERWTKARNRDAARGKTREPLGECFELPQRRVVEERIAAVEEARDAAGLDVARNTLGFVEIDGAARRILPRQWRDREDAVDVSRTPYVRRAHVRAQVDDRPARSGRDDLDAVADDERRIFDLGAGDGRFQAKACRGCTASCDRGCATHSRAR
jgi:hypothetical protein